MLPVVQMPDVDKINKEVEESLKKQAPFTETIKDVSSEYIENETRINLSEIDFEGFLKECPPDEKQIDAIYHLFDES